MGLVTSAGCECDRRQRGETPQHRPPVEAPWLETHRVLTSFAVLRDHPSQEWTPASDMGLQLLSAGTHLQVGRYVSPPTGPSASGGERAKQAVNLELPGADTRKVAKVLVIEDDPSISQLLRIV